MANGNTLLLSFAVLQFYCVAVFSDTFAPMLLSPLRSNHPAPWMRSIFAGLKPPKAHTVP